MDQPPSSAAGDIGAVLDATAIRALLDCHGRTLLELAARSLRQQLATGAAGPLDLQSLPEDLTRPGASFVTLIHHGELRGCIGSVRAWRPLAADVAANAVAAAFEDPRFSPLTSAELDGLSLSASILTTPEPLTVTSEPALLAMLRPGRDGLILREGTRQGVFLPQVWEKASSPAEFLAWLKDKAGFPRNHWSPALQVLRFETVSVEADNLFD